MQERELNAALKQKEADVNEQNLRARARLGQSLNAWIERLLYHTGALQSSYTKFNGVGLTPCSLTWC